MFLLSIITLLSLLCPFFLSVAHPFLLETRLSVLSFVELLLFFFLFPSPPVSSFPHLLSLFHLIYPLKSSNHQQYHLHSLLLALTHMGHIYQSHSLFNSPRLPSQSSVTSSPPPKPPFSFSSHIYVYLIPPFFFNSLIYAPPPLPRFSCTPPLPSCSFLFRASGPVEGCCSLRPNFFFRGTRNFQE